MIKSILLSDILSAAMLASPCLLIIITGIYIILGYNVYDDINQEVVLNMNNFKKSIVQN